MRRGKEIASKFLNGTLHSAVGIAGEFVLECATDGAPETREKGAWAGDCFKLVGNLAGLRIEFKQEALFAFFDVQAGGGVEKAEAGWAVNDLFNSAHVERPEAQGMDFDGYELTRGYAGLTPPGSQYASAVRAWGANRLLGLTWSGSRPRRTSEMARRLTSTRRRL